MSRTGGILVLGTDLHTLGQWRACGLLIEGLTRVHFHGLLLRTGVGVGANLPSMARRHLILQPWGVADLAMGLNHRALDRQQIVPIVLARGESHPEARCLPWSLS